MEPLTPAELDQLRALPLAPAGAVDLERLRTDRGFRVLAEGEADLFAQGPGQERHYLLSFRAGQPVTGLDLPAGRPGLRLILAPTAGCSLLAGSVEDLPGDLETAIRGGCAQVVLAGLAARAEQASAPRQRTLVGPGTPVDLAAGECAALREPGGWIQVLRGELSPLGQAPLAAGPEDLLPGVEGLWLQAGDGGARIRCLGPGDAPGASRRAGEQRLLACLLEGVARELDRQGDGDQERMARKAAVETRTRRRAFAALAGVLADGNPADPAPGGDGLLEACRQVGAPSGITFRPPPRWTRGATGQDPLAALCRASKVRYRKVALEGAWWRTNAGPLLGWLGTDRAPVALLPRPGGEGGYRLLDPEGGPTRALDPDLAARLDPSAVTFFRPGPEGRTRPGALFALVRAELGGDVRRLLAACLGAGLLGLALPVALGLMSAQVIPAADLHSVKVLFLSLAALAFGAAQFNLARGLAVLRMQTLSGARLQAALVDRVIGLPTAFFRRFTVGDLASRALAVDSVQERLGTMGLGVLLGSAFSLLNLVLLWWYGASLALLALVLVVALVLFNLWLVRRMLKVERRRQDAAGDLAGRSFQLLSGVTKLRVAAAEGRAFAAWCRDLVGERAQMAQGNRLSLALAVGNDAWPQAATLLLFAVVASRLGEDAIAPADFIAFNAALGAFMAGAVALTGSLGGLLDILPLIDRTRPILEAPAEDRSELPDAEALAGRVEASHLHFRYRADAPLVLQDVSFHADPGEFIALTGPSGGGKSTLVRLLLGFERPEAGAVFYDAQDLQGINPAGLRSQLGVVLQNSRLLPGSIYQCITGMSIHTLDEAWAAAEAAGIADDIRAMPMGMHTVVSEDGGGMSGGQRQRLILAAALVRRPRIVLLDEGTSALDNRTQEIVAHTLERLNATRIVIAHRLSTIRKADRIYLLSGGQVVQVGGFEELSGSQGPFRDLVARQCA